MADAGVRHPFVGGQALEAVGNHFCRQGDDLFDADRDVTGMEFTAQPVLFEQLRAHSFGHDLYANLRTLDKAGCARILVQEVPGDERWDAIRDRLARAAVGAAADSGRYSSLGTGVLP
jgi:hypothetical protein